MPASDAPWVQIKILGTSLNADRISDLLESFGALSISFADAGDFPLLEPLPGERKLWPETEITGLYASGTDSSPILAALKKQFGEEIPAAVVPLEERNWIREWMSRFTPVKCGSKLWICPTWLKVAEPGSVVVMLDPGLAFGSGTHATTWLCLNFLDRLCLEGKLQSKRVLDYGCGSGILGIAALKLGAASATGIDIDEQALLASRENAARNQVAERLTLLKGEEGLLEPEPFAVVVANILAEPLIKLEPRLAALSAPGGVLALSGILNSQAQEVAEAYSSDFELSAPVCREDWALLTGIRRQNRAAPAVK